jgi:ribosomal protein L7Ae-like RNA K-turn-binding protein
MNEVRLRGMLGFAMRAGKLTIGTELVCTAMANKKNAPKVVLVASDASDGTKKKVFTKCEFYEIKAVQLNMSAEELGSLLGKSFAPVTVGVMDGGFAEQILKAIGEEI